MSIQINLGYPSQKAQEQIKETTYFKTASGTSQVVYSGGVLSSVPSDVIEIAFGDQISCLGNSCCYKRQQLQSVVIPDSVVSVAGDGTFDECPNLSSVTIGSGLSALTDSMFRENKALSTIVIPNNILEIYNNFGGSNYLTATIPNTIQKIQLSFSNTGLTGFALPATLTSMNNSFNNCNKLVSVDFSNCSTSSELDLDFYSCFNNCNSNIKFYFKNQAQYTYFQDTYDIDFYMEMYGEDCMVIKN